MMRRMMFLPIFGGCVVLLIGVSGCGASFKTDPVRIELAIYTPDCVDVLDASTAAGANLQLYACGAGKKSQEWEMIGFGNDQTELMNENSQMCMSVVNAPPTSPDTALGQWVFQSRARRTAGPIPVVAHYAAPVEKPHASGVGSQR